MSHHHHYLVPALLCVGAFAARTMAQEPTTRSDSIHAGLVDTTQYDTTKAAEKVAVSEWGMWDPGRGFKVAKTRYAELSLSGYVLFRYLNQLPASQTYSTHLDTALAVNTRHDLQLQRIMVFLNGWLLNPRLRYTVMFWTVNSTAQVAIGGNLSYTFAPWLTLYGGYGSLPGSRSMVGVFPYFLASDRVLTDEFFRPGFAGALWANGRIAPGLFYSATLANNLSQLGTNAAKLNRYLAKGASIFWEPTTHEFGDRGGFGDYDEHTEVATRLGASYTWSREDRRNEINASTPDNTQLRLSDGVFLFQTGALAPGVTLQWADYNLVTVDAAAKYRGWFLYGQGYFRRLDRFIADGPLPTSHVYDDGFDIQTAYMLVPRTVMLFAWTSQLFGQFNKSWDVATGVNWYPYGQRSFRLNGTVIYVDHSAWNSVFGYYVGGQTGPTVSVGADVFF